MVGIVIVSHSKRLAEGVKELAAQMTRGKVPVEAAGGIDDPDNPIGTDPMKVLAAIRKAAAAAAGGEVLVLMDLGSALMSAEAALDFLPDAAKTRVRLCAAPLVEGAMSAAVQASAGASLEAVAAEALAALTAKQQQLSPVSGIPGAAAIPAGPEDSGADRVEIRLVIRNRIGLHARPAASLVVTAAKFQSVITVFKGAETASAKSINQVATLGARRGDEIRIRAVGPDAQDAVAAIAALGADNFGESHEEIIEAPRPAAGAPAVTKSGLICGRPASPGVAVGPAYVFRPALPEVETRPVDDPEAEIVRLMAALHTARRQIDALAVKTKQAAGRGGTTIFDVHRLILDDPTLIKQAQRIIRAEKISAEAAWLRVVQTTASAYRSLDDLYMQARAADVIDAGSRVIRLLTGRPRTSLSLEAPAVIVAHDLLPSEVARFDPTRVLGIVTAAGGSASHAAILARSLGIPAVVGAGPAVCNIACDTAIALDGDSGRIWLAPDEALRRKLEIKRTRRLEKRRRDRQAGQKPAVTTDGISVHITANIGSVQEASRALAHGAEGVGLLRTEFFFQQRADPPTEDEQYRAYTAVARAMPGRPVIIRTLDVGGDKPLFDLGAPGEDNCFLGQRGIRFCLAHPAIFRPQLRALLRAAREENIKIMFPMVAHLAELREARVLLEEAGRVLARQGIVCNRPVETGIMIEVPAAVALADQLAEAADFFSIGTNDLTQYTMAADRSNTAVAALCDSFHPALLRMVHTAVQAAHGAGIPVGICGELAANPMAAPLLIGLGLDELSMNIPNVPEVKAAIRKLSAKKCRKLAQKALHCEDAAAVRQLLANSASGSDWPDNRVLA